MKVKPGNRVAHKLNNESLFDPKSDVGTVVEAHETKKSCWWVDWDDGRRLYLRESEMLPAPEYSQSNIEAAIKLLKEHGYIVMKQM